MPASARRAALVSLLLCLVSTAGVIPALAAPDDGLRTTGWVLPSTSSAVIARDASALDQVDVVGSTLRADGGRVSAPGRDALRLLRRSQALGLHTELLLSGWSNRLEDFDPRAAHRLLSSPARTRAVARRLGAIVRRQGWDGVNVDLERLQRRDADGLVRLVRQLQAAMPPERTVTVDVSAATSLRAYRARGYLLRGLGRAADAVVLMTYDYSGPTWTGPGPIGPLDWQERAARAALAVVPADRLDLGIAGYGYTWPRAASGRTGRSVTVAAARRLVRADGARARWHRAEGEWSARLSDGTVLWWSDARSHRLRVAMAGRLGLRGVAVWRLGSADALG